jgi:formylglycine-generating enzyme required for sulfatase activity
VGRSLVWRFGLAALAAVCCVADSPAGEAMVRVPAGSFMMGDGGAWCGSDEREVTLTTDFLLAPFEVTNREYRDLLQWAYDRGYVWADSATVRDALDGCDEELVDLDDEDCEITFDGALFGLRPAPSAFAREAYPEGYDPADHPVKEVTWFGAIAYCDWMSLRDGLPRAYDHARGECSGGDPYASRGYRLPTDAEREYAAQYDDERIYPWGNTEPDGTMANFNAHGLGIGWTVPVGSYPPAPWVEGHPLYDMSGNVSEWCNDWRLCDLGHEPQVDPVGPPRPAEGSEPPDRVIRGGSWPYEAVSLRCAHRYGNPPYESYRFVGFRVARSAP